MEVRGVHREAQEGDGSAPGGAAPGGAAPPAFEAELQRCGLLMNLSDALWHRRQGRRVIRIGWGSYAPHPPGLTDEDRQATDWVVCPV